MMRVRPWCRRSWGLSRKPVGIVFIVIITSASLSSICWLSYWFGLWDGWCWWWSFNVWWWGDDDADDDDVNNDVDYVDYKNGDDDHDVDDEDDHDEEHLLAHWLAPLLGSLCSALIINCRIITGHWLWILDGHCFKWVSHCLDALQMGLTLSGCSLKVKIAQSIVAWPWFCLTTQFMS